jgi:hypothetical protein
MSPLRTKGDILYCFLCLPLNAAICTTIYLERQKCYGPDKKILFKKPLFDLEVKGQGPMKVTTVCDTLPYGHAPTYEISLTYLERQKSYVVSVVHVYVLNIGFYNYGLRKISREWWPDYYVSPSNEGRHIVLVWFFLPLLLSKACPNHNFFGEIQLT